VTKMTKDEKATVEELRRQGYGYQKIANMMGISRSTIKSHLTRRTAPNGVVYCRQCRRIVPQMSGRKKKLYCNDKCRMDWWNSHRNQVSTESYQTFTCSCCGEEFLALPSSGRKYCSRECYIDGWFWHG